MPHVARHGNAAFLNPADNNSERDEDSFNGVKEETENLSGLKSSVASLSALTQNDNQVSDKCYIGLAGTKL